MSRSLLTALTILPILLSTTACMEPEFVEAEPNPDRVSRVVISADGDVGAMVAGHNAFSWDVYAELVDGNEDNVFFSPFSTTAALSMTMAGASGTTLAEMADVLHVDMDAGD